MCITYSVLSYKLTISILTFSILILSGKAAFHANPGAERNFAESSSYILIHIFLKFSNTSAKNNVSL